MSMSKIFQTTTLATLLTFGLIAGTTMAQTDGATAKKGQQAAMDSGKMMGKHHGQGMGCMGKMGGKMKGHGKMGMHHGMKMDGKGMGCMGMDGMKDCMAMMDKMSDTDRQEFMNQTKELRKKMMSKRFDYKEMMRDPASTDKQKEALKKEMEALHDKMMTKMQAFTK